MWVAAEGRFAVVCVQIDANARRWAERRKAAAPAVVVDLEAPEGPLHVRQLEEVGG
jgi:hypothetical protein